MLEFKQLTIKNFGPFKGTQVIEFPNDHGVGIVYGQNMRGKTSLLNAVRYALYGKILTRGSKSMDFHKVINSEVAEDAEYTFSVALEFENDAHTYELTRVASPRDKSRRPEKHDDYSQDYFLSRDGDVLGPNERDLVLEQIMPEQVSRFFLFDGELLQEYEELVAEESEIGRKIKESIERILGLPILTNSRSDIGTLRKDAQRQESKTAQTDQNTRQIGNWLADLNEERTQQEAELERLKKEYTEKQEEKKHLTSELKKNERALNLLDDKEQLEKSIEDQVQKKDSKLDKIKEFMSGSWQWMLNEQLENIVEQNEAEIERLQEQKTQKAVSEELKETLEKAVLEKICPTCEQGVPNTAIEKIQKKLNELSSDFDSEESKKLEKLIEIKSKAKDILTENKKETVEGLLQDIEDIFVEISDMRDRIREIDEQVEGIDEEETRKIHTQHEKTVKELTILEQGIVAQEEAINKVNVNIENLQKQMSKLVGKNISRDTYRRELCENLFHLFNEGVAEYRDLLRNEIEKDATMLFKELTTEPDYNGLRINQNYGLTIIHKNGQEVPVRSAGSEHIVALSLMGALQKNAPFRGPIIMDSPFGRLDDQHAPNVVRSLPLMAKQVLLLVFTREMQPALARNELKSKLLSEYQLVRRTAFYTEIEKYIGD